MAMTGGMGLSIVVKIVIIGVVIARVPGGIRGHRISVFLMGRGRVRLAREIVVAASRGRVRLRCAALELWFHKFCE